MARTAHRWYNKNKFSTAKMELLRLADSDANDSFFSHAIEMVGNHSNGAGFVYGMSTYTRSIQNLKIRFDGKCSRWRCNVQLSLRWCGSCSYNLADPAKCVERKIKVSILQSLFLIFIMMQLGSGHEREIPKKLLFLCVKRIRNALIGNEYI